MVFFSTIQPVAVNGISEPSTVVPWKGIMPLQSSKVDDCAFEDALFHAMAVVQCHLPLRQADEENRGFLKHSCKRT